MKTFLLCLTILFVASVARPQTVDVVELTPSETTAARIAYENLQKAQAEWANVQATISKKYNHGGYAFSKNFKFYAPQETPIVWSCGNISDCGCITAAPAFAGEGSFTAK